MSAMAALGAGFPAILQVFDAWRVPMGPVGRVQHDARERDRFDRTPLTSLAFLIGIRIGYRPAPARLLTLTNQPLAQSKTPLQRRLFNGDGTGARECLPSTSTANHTTSMSTPICLSFGHCGRTSASPAPNTAAASRNAAPARSTSTGSRCAPA